MVNFYEEAPILFKFTLISVSVILSSFSQQSSDKKVPISVPTEADAVVIGGGSIGPSTLYHLAKLGVTNTVLLERDQLSSGTS